MNQNVVRAAIFDLDGTLLDTLLDLTGAVNHIFRKYGFAEKKPCEIRSYLGNGARELLRRALGDGVDDRTVDTCLDEYKEYYRAHSNIETKPYDGVVDLLEELKARGIKVAVVSNKPDPAAKILCREYFGELVDFALGDRADIERKPNAAPVKLAIKELGCHEAIYIGDSEVDVMTAKNAALPCISLLWGFGDRDVLEAHGAEVLVSDVAELKREIFRLLKVEDDHASN